jgi:hypothetical protein
MNTNRDNNREKPRSAGMKKSRIICTFLSSHLVAVIFLVLLHIHEASACTYPPTAVILTSPSGTIFYNGNPILLDGSNSTANNGGSINQYRWRYSPTGWDDWTLIYQGTQPTRNFTFPALGSGENQKSYQIELQVRNTSGAVSYDDDHGDAEACAGSVLLCEGSSGKCTVDPG